METETNLAQIFRQRAERYGDAVRWRQRHGQDWRSATWRQNQALVNSLIAGLDALGVRRGEVVGILSNTRWEWMAADWAILGLGAITTALYPAQVPETFAFILHDSGARYVFVEDRTQYEKLRSVRQQIPDVRKLILFDDADTSDDPWAISFARLCRLGERTPEEADALAAERASAIRPEDRASIIYTSGTTGQPKGAVHTHAALLAQVTAGAAMLPSLRPGMVDLLWLPLAHVMGRVEHLGSYEQGLVTVVAPSLLRLARDLREVKPDVLFSAPQVYEKAYATIMSKAKSGPRATQWLFRRARRIGSRVARLRQKHVPVPIALRVQHGLADRLVLRRVREAFGGRLLFALSGAAALAPDILEFFHGAGVLVLEGWGLTETAGGLTVNTMEQYRLGTVGRAYPGHEVRLALDGEILVRGPCLCTGYHNNPAATAEAFDAEGWFHTGDIGALDSDGFLRIADRAKDLIVTAGGENVAPQLVEQALRAIPTVAQACVYGEGRPYVVALLTLDSTSVQEWAEHQGMGSRDSEAVATTPEFRAFLDEQVAQANAKLTTYEAVRSFDVLPEEFTVEDEDLTPVQKIRRQHIYARYRPKFEALYHGKQRAPQAETKPAS
jgi:long-chain acyl-CoA synthetase